MPPAALLARRRNACDATGFDKHVRGITLLILDCLLLCVIAGERDDAGGEKAIWYGLRMRAMLV